MVGTIASVTRGRQNGDPIGSEKRRGKAASQRKGRYDGGWTPTEQHKRDQLMKQFVKLEGPSGNSEAFKRGYDAIRWSDK